MGDLQRVRIDDAALHSDCLRGEAGMVSNRFPLAPLPRSHLVAHFARDVADMYHRFLPLLG